MKMKIPRHDVAEVFSSGSSAGPGQRGAVNPVAAARARGISVTLKEDSSAPTELNVIGRNVDEATSAVEKFIDRAFLAGLTRVRIVHGSGMGILRKALRQYLQKHPHVATVAEPQQNEGGAGATVVGLREEPKSKISPRRRGDAEENKIAKIAEIAKEWKLKIKSFNRKGHEGTQRGKKSLKDARRAELRKEIVLGAREADRSKFVDGARTFADIRRKSKQRKTAGG